MRSWRQAQLVMDVSGRQIQPSAPLLPMAFPCEAMVQSELGDQLRRARENKGWSLEDAEKVTGIRRRYLQAIEEGRFDAMPGDLQARGFLKNYATYVGLNGEEAMAYYEQARSAQTLAQLQPTSPARPAAVQPIPPASRLPLPPMPKGQVARPSGSPSASGPLPSSSAPQPVIQPSPFAKLTKAPSSSRLPSWLTLELVLVAMAVVLVICVAALVVYLLSGAAAGQSGFAPRPTAARTARSVPPTLVLAEPTSAPSPNVLNEVRMASAATYVQVALAATEHVWVRVTTDGKTAFEGMLAPGQALNWEAKEMLIVEAGNGAGLTASFNGRPIGVLGSRGQIVARAWSPSGETTVPAKPTASLPTQTPTP